MMQTAVFDDFEKFAASLHHVDLRVMLTYDRGQRWRTQQAALNRLSIHYGSEGGGIICEGACLPDRVAFFVPMKNPEAIYCNGSACDDRCWMLQVPGREFCYNVTGPNEWVTVFIPLDIWAGLSADLRQVPANRLIPTSPHLLGTFRDLIGRFLSIDHGNSRFLQIPSIQDAIEDDLLSVIASIVHLEQDRTTVTFGRPAIPRDQVMQRAMNWLDGQDNYRVSTTRLASVAGVSERTLRSIFREFYGMGPLRYLKLRKLHLMRRALRQADPQADSVARIATQIGIGEFGRFSRDYRQLFRESPTESLCRSVAG